MCISLINTALASICSWQLERLAVGTNQLLSLQPRVDKSRNTNRQTSPSLTLPNQFPVRPIHRTLSHAKYENGAASA